VHQAELEALASARERALEGAEAAMRPQIPTNEAVPSPLSRISPESLPVRVAPDCTVIRLSPV